MSRSGARRHVFHPRRARLLGWLDAAELGPNDRLTAHLETCTRCAKRLDRLVLGDDAPDDDAHVLPVDERSDEPSVAAVLRDAWIVPDELPTRIHRAIDERVRAQREFDLLLGLVSIGTDTAELLLPSSDGDPEPQRNPDDIGRSDADGEEETT